LFYHGILLPTDMLLFSYFLFIIIMLLVDYLFIHVATITLFLTCLILYVRMFICTSTSPLHTLIRSFLTTLDLHVQIGYALFQWLGVRWACACYKESGVSLYLIPVFLSLLPSFIPGLLLDTSISDLASIPFLISFNIMCGHMYMLLQWSCFIIVQICSLFSVT